VSNVERIAPDHMRSLIESGNYAPAVRAGDLVFVAGQVGRDETLSVVSTDLEAHIEAAFRNLADVLASAGATLSDVVELVSYHTDVPGQMSTFQQVKRRWFPDTNTLPAWTAVGVRELNSPAFLVEIKAVAYAPR